MNFVRNGQAIASADRYEKLHTAIADPEERTYRANVTQLDDAFGTLMKPPDEIGAAESTLVFFTSDNGPEGQGARGPGRGLAGGLRGRKRAMHEGGHRVPGILRWPAKIASGTTSGLPGIGSDFFPTALAAAGVVAIAPPRLPPRAAMGFKSRLRSRSRTACRRCR